MEITNVVQTNGFEKLGLDERSNAFDEYMEKKDCLQHTGEMITLLDGKVWAIANEYDIGELTVTLLLPSEY